MCHKCPKRFSKTRIPEFLERRPSEDLRSSLPLSALPVLARKGSLRKPTRQQPLWLADLLSGRSTRRFDLVGRADGLRRPLSYWARLVLALEVVPPPPLL